MTYMIAEAGSNWTPGNLDSALALVSAAADAGANAVKFQYFRAAQMDRPKEWREKCGAWDLPVDWIKPLRNAAKASSLLFILSLFEWNLDAACHCDVLKIGSSELGNDILLQTINANAPSWIWSGVVYLSTGETGYAAHQIGLALSWLNRCDVTLMHCVCQYPTPITVAIDSVRRIDWLADTFGLPVGWSSHVAAPDAAPFAALAVQHGATVVEAHLKLETTPKECPDSGPWSLLPGEFAELVEAVREEERRLGFTLRAELVEALREVKQREGCDTSGSALPKSVAAGVFLVLAGVAFLSAVTYFIVCILS